jgi:hypothetical protein
MLRRASTDRRWFEADENLPSPAVGSSIKHKEEGSTSIANTRERSLIKDGLIEEISRLLLLHHFMFDLIGL